MTMTEFSIGGRPVPSISVPPSMTSVCARAGDGAEDSSNKGPNSE
jgi:hypothetical protein